MRHSPGGVLLVLAVAFGLSAGCGLNTVGLGPGEAGEEDGGEGMGDVPPVDDGTGEDVRPDDATEGTDGVEVDDGDGDDGTISICGNGIVEGAEECDDGNTIETDECVSTCMAAVCGDGYTYEGVEDCDNGIDNDDETPDACRTDCRAAHCGDAVTDTGEGCDDGNDDNDDGCRNDCSLSTCGDAAVDPGEDCDDGNAIDSDDCLSTCRDASCGDGFVWATHEECDGDAPTACTASCGSSGSRPCVACAWSLTCVPPVEICNALDDDCDGSRDEDFLCVPGDSVGCATVCGSTGTGPCTTTCGVPAPGSCTPPAEICNALDDDCDGTADDGFACVPGASVACTTTCGSSGSGLCTVTCTPPASTACTPPGETCDGADENCDTVIDDGFLCALGATRSCSTTCGSSGTQSCGTGCVWSTCAPPPEACNSIDDDCDTLVDETLECTPGTTRVCSTSCGSTSTQTCGAGCVWGTCTPPAETCNALDDDCDTVADDGFACIQGRSTSCSTSCGTIGTGLCGVDCSAPATCTPPAETCNNADDDCDTAIDDGFACRIGATQSCTTTCFSTGSRICSASCTWPTACTPPAEICNGVDDDCDAVADDGFACRSGQTGTCTTTCSSTGTRLCTSSCTWPATCTPPAETCNNRDDDCDGTTDDGFACRIGATQTCTTTCFSTGSRICSAACTWPTTCTPPAEACNAADDDCDTLTDEGFTCVRGTIGSCTTSCGSTGIRTCSTSCTWGTCTPPVETCNGRDDDCDTSIDEGLGICNETCDTAIDITSLGSVSGDTTSAASERAPCGAGCSGNATNTPDVWYRFTLTGREVVFLSLDDGNAWDSTLEVMHGSCGALVGDTCSDDACGGYRSQWVGWLPAGTYYVLVDGCAATSYGAFTLTFRHSPCATATEAANGVSSTGTTCGAVNDLTPSCGGGNDEDRVYFAGVCRGTRTVVGSNCADGQTWPSTVAIRRGSGGTCGNAEVACGVSGTCGAPSVRATASGSVVGPELVFFIQDGGPGGAWCGNYGLTTTW